MIAQPSPERVRELAEWRTKEARRFYDMLGAERPAVPCRDAGCHRGAIELSVLCRPHHFEMIHKRPCPFDD